jgi:hypothetical protein
MTQHVLHDAARAWKGIWTGARRDMATRIKTSQPPAPKNAKRMLALKAALQTAGQTTAAQAVAQPAEHWRIRSMTTSTVTFTEKHAEAVSPEGQHAVLPISDVFRRLVPPKLDTGDLILPDGTKAVLSRGDVTIIVHQTAPAVHNFKWVAEGSPVKFGPGTVYRDLKLGQPYIIVFAAFQKRKPGGELVLGGRNECFYRTAPLASLRDELLYPALLNCSKYRQEEKHSLSWICSAKLDASPYQKLKENNGLVRAGFRALMQTLLESGFNYSSEAHEGASWHGETLRAKVDPRNESVERWEQETQKNPLFVLDVPWLKTGRTVAQVAERIFGLFETRTDEVSSSEDVARAIFNSK